MRRIAAGGDRRETVRDGVERRHAGPPVGERAGDGDRDVDAAQLLRGPRDARRELRVLDRPRRFGAHELHAADAQHRQQRDSEHDHADTAEPLHLHAVVKERLGHRVQAAQHGRARRRVARDGFEHRVGDGQLDFLGQQQRHCARRADHEPEQGDDEESVAHTQLADATARRPPDQRADREQGEKCVRERFPVAVAVVQRHAERRQHGDADQHHQQAENPLHREQVHAPLRRGTSNSFSTTSM